MSSFDDLLRRLDAVGANDWEEEYARVAVELTREQAFEVAGSERPYAMWFAFRFDAGPPGTPLPSAEAAHKAVLSAKDGSALDAYRVVFASPPVPEDASPDLRLTLLRKAAFCALTEGKLWFGTWLAARAGLAAIALGVPEAAWLILDTLTVDGRRRQSLEVLADFAPLRSSETAQRSPWVRAAICHLWPRMGVPAIPSLPPPSGTTSDVSIDDTLAELSRIGATRVRALVERFAKSVVGTLARTTLERHADEPLIRELRRRASEGTLVPPTIGELPSWFRGWACAVARVDEPHLARLAGLVLRGVSVSDKKLAATLVLPAARSADLEILAAGLDVPELQTLFAELKVAREALPIEVADALVAVALPNHVREGEALGVLAQHLGLLQGAIAPPGGTVDRIATMMRALVAERQRDHEAARPLVEQVKAAVHREAGQLSTVGRRLSEADVERSAAKIRVPEVATGLLDAACEATQGLPALDRLLLALALRRAVADSDHRQHWEAPLAKLAADSIRALGEPELLDLRLRLLDEAIQAAHPLMSIAELHCQRAITRQAVEAGDERTTDRALADLSTAIRLARAEGDPGLCAAATATWVKLLVRQAGADGSDLADRRAEAELAIADVLGLPLDPYDRATVHQARAHLVRLHSPDESVSAFESALSLLVPRDPYWAEIAAELVVTLVGGHRVEDAVQRGTEFLSRVPGDAVGVQLGMLHLALGEAYLASGRENDAKRRFEDGLDLVRGRDPQCEAWARVSLVSLGLAAGDSALREHHLQFLRDHRVELDPQRRRELDRLEAIAAGARGDAAHQQAVLTRTLAAEKDDRVRVGLRIEIARLDLAAGREVDDIDALVALGLKTDLDGQYVDELTSLLCNHGGVLAPPTREAAVDWARQRSPSIRARLQHLAGRVEEACTTLRAALAGDLSDRERLGCTHQMMTLLPDEAHTERRALCDELERLLGVVEDVPHIRLDLASGLRMVTGDELSVLQRARAQARRALEAPLSAREREFGHRTMGQTTVDLLRLSLPLSSALLAREASCLLEELALSDQEASGLRLDASLLLLVPGPLTHPDALSMAGRLLNRVNAPPGTREHGAALERLRWVRDRIAPAATAATMPTELRGPFDQLPNWLIGHVHARGGTVAPDELARAASILASVVRVRPDAADSLVALAISLQHKLSGSRRQELLDAVLAAVQAAVEVGNESWRRLRGALDGVRKKHQHPMLARILSATRRASSDVGREPTSPHAADDGPNPAPVARVAGRSRARECWERGVAQMDILRRDPFAGDAGLRVAEARALLGEAVAIARRKRMPELFGFLVSCGNAWKMRPDEDIEKALRIYESAATLDPAPEQEATLWKVHADALRLRGSADDLRNADGLLQRACGVRRGRFLAEALMSRALVAHVHPDLNEEAREREAAGFAMDAVRAHREFGEERELWRFLLGRLAAWERKRPDDTTPARFRGELKTMYPERAAQIDAPVPRVPRREIECWKSIMAHPSGEAFMEVRTRLVPASDLRSDPLGLLAGFGPTAKAALRQQIERDSLVGHPDRVEAVLDSLSTAPDDPALAGRLAARVVLLADLCRARRRTAGDVRSATDEAIDAINNLDETVVRSVLLRGIAGAWAPDDHADDPVRDFGLAADLLRRCVEIEGGEDKAMDDSLTALARALRYSPVGDLEANLREARRLYQLCLERARGNDGPDLIANLLSNLAEVESQIGTGSRVERLRAAEQRLEEAVSIAQSSHWKAQYTARLAWERTQIGILVGGPEVKGHLEKALATFNEVDTSLLDDHARSNVEGNRCVCEATLARLVGGREAEIVCWRRHLAKLDDRAAPYRVATAKHNLGNVLTASGDITPDGLAEGLRLLREAAAVRALEVNARHHWETSLCVGNALMRVLASGRHDLLPFPSAQAAAETRVWLRRAADAARVLGPGEELLQVAFALVALAGGAPAPAQFVDDTEEAWTLVRDASAYLLLSPESLELEARVAAETAARLAYRLAESSPLLPSQGLAFVLHGDSARLVERWIVRSQQPARRPLQARLCRPEAVSPATWDAWRDALCSGDQRRMGDALDRVRESAPTFLAEDHTNEVTWRWLAARPGSVAVALVLAEPVSVALLMHVDGAGNRKSWAVGLRLGPRPLPVDALTGLMRNSDAGASAHASQDVLAQWVRRGVVEPIERFLGVSPSVVLWSPGPCLRLVAPNAVWRTVPVVSATSVVLPDLRSSPSRRRSSLVVLADPGAETSDPRLDLRGQGVPTLQVIELAAARRGGVRLLGSVGQRFGRALLGERSDVRDTPASARDVLLEAAEHETIILLAHGEVESLEDAAVLCVDASGNIDRLDVAQLGRSPDAFAGATVLLLSCEGGRMGYSMIGPGGLAGTLLSAGAACVVAPLWPVRLDAAELVGRAVLEGMASGEEPWAVLAKLIPQTHGDSPSLGRPAPSLSERRADQTLQRLAFVAWVG